MLSRKSGRLIAFGLFAAFLFCLWPVAETAAETPLITGSPTIDQPLLLNWPRDVNPVKLPDLTEPTANRIFDLHASIGECDLVLSTAGNYHMALRDLWYDAFLPRAAANGIIIRNWIYTTSPPISPDQIANGFMGTSNFQSQCKPQVAVGPQKLMDRLKPYTTDIGPVSIFKNRGNVILVKKGNPKNIQSIWDLGRDDIRVVTSNPYQEQGSFGNYRDSIYNIALNDPAHPPEHATRLFNAIFNNTTVRGKWLSGNRIHHREVPYSIAYGHADAGLLFYHLAVHAVRTFPDLFTIVPLGGTIRDPDPLPGNKIGELFAVRIIGPWNPTQERARELLMEALQTDVFTTILHNHGLDRPYYPYP